MRVRLTLIAVALAVLAFAGPDPGDRLPLGLATATGTTSQLAAEPAPEPALPALEDATAVRSALIKTSPHAGWRRDFQPAHDWFVALRLARISPGTYARPRSFPLLI